MEKKRIVILGAGTAGTLTAYHLRRKKELSDWQVTIIDGNKHHDYQPGYLFIPFSIYDLSDVRKPVQSVLPKGPEFINENVKEIDAESQTIRTENGSEVHYDILIIATGSRIAPEETEGLTDENTWRKNAFDFYTADGALALEPVLQNFKEGNLVVHLTEMPIKCPVAPLEFAFLSEYYFRKKGLRDSVNITYVTPLDGAFTKPKAAAAFGNVFEERGIKIVTEFNAAAVDGEKKQIVSYDERTVDYDLLVTIPVNMGSTMIEESGLGDELSFVPTDKNTLQSKIKENIFVIGDATDAPTSKAGSVAHFEGDVLVENIIRFAKGEELLSTFDGHANCFIESGYKKGFLIDFNYEQEPVEGKFPIPGIGPLSLLKEARRNHWGKMAFKWVYWSYIVKGKDFPFVTSQMKTAGKKID